MVIINLLLNVVALLLYIAITPINFLYVVFFKLHNEDFLSRISGYFKVTAIAIDRFGNVNFKGLFNSLFLTNKDLPFGDYHETISSCLGKNQLFGSLSRAGRILTWILDLIETDHCIKSIKATPREIKQGMTTDFWKIYCKDVLGENKIKEGNFYEEFFNEI